MWISVDPLMHVNGLTDIQELIKTLIIGCECRGPCELDLLCASSLSACNTRGPGCCLGASTKVYCCKGADQGQTALPPQ